MKLSRIIIIGFTIILALSIFVSIFGGGKDLYEMLEGSSVLEAVTFIVVSLGLIAFGYGIALILITWIEFIAKWLKELRKGTKESTREKE